MRDFSGPISPGKEDGILEAIKNTRPYENVKAGFHIILSVNYAVLLNAYTTRYGGRILNAVPEPVLPDVLAVVVTL